MREEGADLLRPHFGGVTFFVEQYEISDPECVRLFRPDAIVTRAQSFAHLIQEFRHDEILLRVKMKTEGGLIYSCSGSLINSKVS